jgi:hypothetical protein
MKTSVLLIILLFLVANCSKDVLTPENEANSYQLKINYLSEMGNVVVDPLLDRYLEGTVVKISASPNQGVAFKNWDIDSKSYIQKEMTVVMNADIEINANFVSSKNENYTIKTSCESCQGAVSCSPVMESYPMGTTVQISAIAKQGYTFSHWEGMSSNSANIRVDITQNLDLKAIFKVETTQNNQNPLFTLEIKYNKDNVWTVKADLSKQGDNNGITDAVIKVNNQQLDADDFFLGEYSKTIDALNPGQNVTISLEHSSIGLKTYELKVPDDFTQNPSLTGSINNGEVTISWENVNCSEYMLYKKLENNSGTSATVNVYEGSSLTATSYSASVSDIMSSYVNISPAPVYFSLWVCPANTLKITDGLHSGSYIRIIGKNSNSATNKSN